MSELMPYLSLIATIAVGWAAYYVANKQAKATNLGLALEVANRYATLANSAFESAFLVYETTPITLPMGLEHPSRYLTPMTQAIGALEVICGKDKNNHRMSREAFGHMISPMLYKEIEIGTILLRCILSDVEKCGRKLGQDHLHLLDTIIKQNETVEVFLAASGNHQRKASAAREYFEALKNGLRDEL